MGEGGGARALQSGDHVPSGRDGFSPVAGGGERKKEIGYLAMCQDELVAGLAGP